MFEDLLEKKFDVLDKGFIKVIDYMGDDQAVIDAARVSYQKGTKRILDDRTLIRYLMRNNHSSPFEMCELKLMMKMPIYCARQLVRHRTASMNEESQRYSEVRDEFEESSSDEWRIQSSTNKQGSEGFINNSHGNEISYQEKKFNEKSSNLYNKRISDGVAREQARKCLPLSVYTNFYWKMDLRNLFHFLRLRMDSHAQYEIRQYATIIGYEIVSKIWPIAWEAFLDYSVNSINLTAIDIKVIQYINNSNWEGYHEFKQTLNKRELSELENKLELLNIKVNNNGYTKKTSDLYSTRERETQTC